MVLSSMAYCTDRTTFQDRTKNTLRPVGVRNPLLKIWHRQVVIQNKSDPRIFLEPQQIASSQAGAAKLVMAVRSLIELNRDWVVLKLDIFNAFNENSRAAVIETLESEPTLKHLAWFAATVLAPYSGLETGGRRWGETQEGGTQGGPESAPFSVWPSSQQSGGWMKDAKLPEGWPSLGWTMAMR